MTVGRRTRHQQPEAEEQQLRESDQLESSPYKCGRDDVVDEKRSVVGQENATPTTYRMRKQVYRKGLQ